MSKGFFGLTIGGDKKEAPVREGDKPARPMTNIETAEQAANYLAKIKADADKGRIDRTMFPKGEEKEGITTATDPERREFLNYAINLMPDNMIKYKILLFLRVNPYWEDDNGNQKFLSKSAIAQFLTKECGFKVSELEVSRIEKEGVARCMDNLNKLKLHDTPIVGHNKF